jgi:glycine/D-amino acid oxidase-like deaminating enzyme
MGQRSPTKIAGADALVLGGGIVGASVALHLRRRGLSAILIERDRVGQRASGVNFGGVRQQGRALIELPLSRRARQMWRDLPLLIGIDGEFVADGHLRLARSDADMAVIEQHCRDAAGYGLNFELLGRNAVMARFPWLGSVVLGGSFSGEDGQANPRLVSPAFADAARRAGVEIHEGVEIVAGMGETGGFRLTARDGAEYAAPRLFNCAGAWAGTVAGWFGEGVAINPETPQVMVTEPIAHRIDPVLGVVGGDLYLRQIARGNVIFGGGEGAISPDWLRSRPKPDVARLACRTAVSVVPHLRNAAIIRIWTGVDGDTADGSPVVGPSRRHDGLFHAFGFCGHGFQLGPAAGAALVDLAVDGRCETDISGLGIERFLGPGR